MSRITENTLPAERSAGAVFSERFKNAGEVVKNGGVIVGTPVLGDGLYHGDASSYIDTTLNIGDVDKFTINFHNVSIPDVVIGDVHTFISTYGSGTGDGFLITIINSKLYFYMDNLVANISYNIIASQKIKLLTFLYDGTEATPSNRLKIFIDGVAVSGTVAGTPTTSFSNTSNVVIGAWTNHNNKYRDNGTFGHITIFNKALSAETILAYSNNIMWSYMNNAVLALPMLLRDHDATNVRTLDKSGNGNNATFGDGSTPTTYPTFSKGCYSFDGTTDYMRTNVWASTVFNASTKKTISVMFKPDVLGQKMIFSVGQNGANRLYLWTDSGLLSFKISNYVSTTGHPSIKTNEWCVATLVIDGLSFKAYKNGELAYQDVYNSFTTTPDGVSLGEHFNNDAPQSYKFDGKISSFFALDTALNDIQVKDLYLKMFNNRTDGNRGI